MITVSILLTTNTLLPFESKTTYGKGISHLRQSLLKNLTMHFGGRKTPL